MGGELTFSLAVDPGGIDFHSFRRSPPPEDHRHEAENQFRRIIGYRDLAKLAVAVEHEVARSRPSPVPAAAIREEVPESATV